MNEQLTLIYGYLHGLWRFRWMALIVAWFIAVAGWLAVFSLPNQYNAKAVVYVDTHSVMKPLLKGLAPEMDAYDELAVMHRVLLSRTNLLSVIRETDMDLNINTPEDREGLLDYLADSITVKGGSSSGRRSSTNNVYEISYKDNSADRVYQVVSILLNTMIEGTLNSSRTDTVAAQKFLDTQIGKYEIRLSSAEHDLAEFKKSNVGFMPDEKGGYYMRLQRAQDAFERTGSEVRLAKRRYKELKRQISGESPLLSRDGYQSATVQKIKMHKERLSELLNLYTEQHPDVQATKAIIADLQASLDTENNSPVDAGNVETYPKASEITEFNPVYQEMKVALSEASVDVETLKIQYSEQKKYVAKLQSSIDVIPEVEAKLAKLNRDYDVTRERYLNLVERRESARLAQSAGQSTSDVAFRVIDSPIVPTSPSGPNRLLLLSGVLLAAIASGLAWSFLKFIMDPTFFDHRQISQLTGMPLLGAVSLYLSPKHRKKRKLQLISFLSVVLLLVVIFVASLVFKDEITAIVNPLFYNADGEL